MAITRASVLILYGSETGNAQDKAEEIDRMCQRLHCRTELKAMDDAQLGELLQDYGLVCFVLSTTGQGHFPNNARKFWKSLRRAKLPPQCLETVQFTTFGLGDSAYHKFNWASRLLNSRLRQLGATELFNRGEADERHDEGVDSIYQPWLKDFKQFLIDTFPVPSYVKPISDEEALPPRFTLSLKLLDDKAAAAPSEAPAEPAASVPLANFPSPELLPHPNTVGAVVVSNKRATPADHWQDVRLLQLDVSFPKVNGSVYEPLPGDRVAIYPKNYPEDVQTLIKFMEWEAVADKKIELSAKRPNGLYPKPDCTLRELLTHNIDFMAVPSRSFLHKLAFYTPHEDQKEKLFELVQPEGSQDFYDFTSRPRRTILEVLHEFYTSRIPYEAIPDIFPIIRGREFSIANGGNELTMADTQLTAKALEPKANGVVNGAAPEEEGILTVYRFDILAALVEYRTIIRKPRVGFCSRYLDNLPVGTPLRVELKRESPPPNGSAAAGRPLIGIATGTGVAPIRSLIQDRSRFSPREETLLFFGCRNKASDFYFSEEWDGFEGLTVIPAFSRDLKEAELEAKVEAAAESGNEPEEGKPEVEAKPVDDKPAQVANGEASTANGANGSKADEEEAPATAATSADEPVVAYKYDEGKSYVQHQIRRHADHVCKLLKKNAIICLCGNSGRMPTSVREALRDAAVSGGFCKDTDEADKLLFNEKDPSRIMYWEETW
ncbi:nitric oxide synthase [Ophiostoma piceae UAMH 11346]|uniref:Nitric oxide synthase n=1 Tax=Ophiostoma piceae (strain UAMH 11346) TaxID=1262450 RepID=S3C4X9_OPHP1|nr:nitric oxide synthase [Ophiostoma piceae UAMH 11346]